ncbi:MAG: universal stress protein [Promethearchaeota archaeon]
MDNLSDVQIKNILLPVDRYHPSLHAIEFCVLLAKKYDSKVKVLHVVPENMIRSLSDSDLQHRLKDELKGHLEQSGRIAISNAKAIFTEEGIPVETTLIEFGNPTKTILNMSSNYDLIVIGVNGEVGYNIGSVLKEVLNNSHSNVLAIKGKKPCNNVLVGYDGSEDSKMALKYASDICQKFSASLLIANATKSILPVIRTGVTKKRSEALLNEAKRLIENVDIDIKLQTIAQKPAQGLKKIAEKENVDLIVIGNKGRSMINRLVMGSVSKKINKNAKISVLTVGTFGN